MNAAGKTFLKNLQRLFVVKTTTAVTVQVYSGNREHFLARFFQTRTMKKQAETHDLSRTLSVANFKTQTQRPDGDVSISSFFSLCAVFSKCRRRLWRRGAAPYALL
jgi:hypothetical protein